MTTIRGVGVGVGVVAVVCVVVAVVSVVTAGPSPRAEPHELTARENQALDNIEPPAPSAHFVMDGKLDRSAKVVASNGHLKLFAAAHDGELYLAITPAKAHDTYIFVRGDSAFTGPASKHTKQLPAPAKKHGTIMQWNAFLAHTADKAAWFDPDGKVTRFTTGQATGAVLEGVIDVELLLGETPRTVSLEVVEYGSGDGAAVSAQLASFQFDFAKIRTTTR